jgi:2-methylcitrate dehydratase
MTGYQTQQMAHFVANSRWEDISSDIVAQLKNHLLDALGSLLHARDQSVIQKLAAQIALMGEGGACETPVAGALAPDRAAQLYTALIRYPDFMDNFLGKEATCHPSDNLGALLAGCQLAGSSGKEFLHCMAIAYAMECRLVEQLPVMIKGFDHTLLLAYSVTAALSKMLGLTEEQTAHALGMAGSSFAPLVSSRASYTFEWKGLASSLVVMGCMNIVLLAKQDVTGPISLFEGPKGFKETFDMSLEYDWGKEDLSLIRKCCLKSYNAEVHTQSAIEAILELREKENFLIEDIDNIDVTTFLTAFHITGGGAYGDRTVVYSKEQADHSMPYVLAAALLDGQVYPEQFDTSRIISPDVRHLMGKIAVHTGGPIHKPLILAGLMDSYTRVYPEELPARVAIVLGNERTLSLEKRDYKGFFTRPFTWDDTVEKFNRLAGRNTPVIVREKIIDAVLRLDDLEARDLVAPLTEEIHQHC